ncbi:MAG: hypothetical protein M3296_11165 [Actinomycetota bacterium]|nr:hypothetical protein [Actinomycetota bacterium]
MEPDHVRVITFNTAAGNPKITTPQEQFLALPFYREALDGEPDAAILALQEVGPAQARALRRRGAHGPAHVLQIRRPGLGNALVIPRRYEVLASRRRYYLRAQARGIGAGLRAWAVDRVRPDWRQFGELRMWIEARLRDRSSARRFTMLTTHISVERSLRLPQVRTIVGRAHRAARAGPVVLAGDLNLRRGSTRGGDAEVQALVASLRDMGTAAPHGRPNIDYVLALGFEPVSSRIWTGDALRLPGHPRAETISDHHAEDDVLRFASPPSAVVGA